MLPERIQNNTITEMRIAASPQVARNERLSGYAGNAGVSKVQKLSVVFQAWQALHCPCHRG
jgi:hypothetical protein